MHMSKGKKVLAWILQVLLGLEFLIAGFAKLSMGEVWQAKFEDWGYPDSFYLVVGVLEMVGGLLIFFPKLASRVAIGLGGIMIAATITHILAQEWKGIVVTLIILVVLTVAYYLRRDSRSSPKS